MDGSELAAGAEAGQTVLVQTVDLAGNPASATAGVVFDFRAPGVGTAVAPARARRDDVLRYTVSVDEPLAAPPRLVVRRDGVEVDGFFGPPAGATELTYRYERVIADGDDGTYAVAVEALDAAGNPTPGAIEGDGFVVDTVAPAVTGLVAGPARVGPGGILTVSFDVPEEASALAVRVGGLALPCGARVAASPNVTCTRALEGDELPPGTEAAQTVLVQAGDLAGNLATASASVVFDFLAPRLTSTVAPSAAKQGDSIWYNVAAAERLAAPPVLEVRKDGVLLPGFFGAPAADSALSYRWTKAVAPGLDGRYEVTVSASDEAGNTTSGAAAAGFVIDSSPPVIGPIAVAGGPAGKGGRVTVAFDAAGEVDVSVQVAGRAAACEPPAETSPRHRCAYALAGDEVPDGTAAGQPIVVRAVDAAGNAATASATVVFDFAPPGVGFALVQYAPAPGNALGLLATKAAEGTTVRVQLSADEPLDATKVPSFTATNGVTTLAFALEPGSLDARGAAFTATVPPGASDAPERYVPTLTGWTDPAGNTAPTTFAAPSILVRTRAPALVVDQASVQYLRSPGGNAAAETLAGGFRVPAGPYYALSPADSLSGASSLPPGTFVAAGGERLAAVRVWADPGKVSLLGAALSSAEGWPRAQLAAIDATTAYVTGVDEAGNESPPVKLENAEWVVTPSTTAFGWSPQTLSRTTYARESRDQEVAATAPAPPGAEAPDASAAIARAAAAWRRRVNIPLRPPGRMAHATAYDAARGRLVLFGGSNVNSLFADALSDTWEWDGEQWYAKPVVGTWPATRSDCAMAYDAARGRVVMFGGHRAFETLDDLWEWDGERWSQVPKAAAWPPARRGHSLAYDEARRVVVLFSGSNLYSPGPAQVADTWEWDGAVWSQRSPAASPPGRYNHRLAYDRARRRIVLYGGRNAARLNDLWEWDGTTWESRPAVARPPARDSLALAYDAARSRLVLHGGYTHATTYYADTWEWDGATWTDVTGLAPAAQRRAYHSMAYDERLRRVVAFGGTVGGGSYMGDIVAWDGRSWSSRTPGTTEPLAGYDVRTAYDPARRRMVFYGSSSTASYATWEWDGFAWAKITESGPGYRSSNALVFDSARARTLSFGGYDGGRVFSDTWAWNGAAWTNLAPVYTPGPRLEHAMAYDSARDRVVLFGGRSLVDSFAAYYYDDTWEFDGTNWARVFPASGGPRGRSQHRMAYDAARGRVVMYGGQAKDASVSGGYAKLTDLWEWDGTAWLERRPAGATPGSRIAHVMAYDSHRGRTLLWGGYTATPDTGTVWEWDGDSWLERVVAGAGPASRTRAAMVYDSERRVTVLFGGNSGLDHNDIWELDAAPSRQPALHYAVAAKLAGIPSGGVSGLRLRARCGGSYAPYAASDVGARLFGWSVGGTQDAAPGWRLLASPADGVAPAIPYLGGPGPLVEWATADPEVIASRLVSRDMALAFQCRPAGTSGAGSGEAAVAMDYVELRIRYRAP
jgi:hypothetical protein